MKVVSWWALSSALLGMSVSPSTAGAQDEPLAGYAHGSFFLRSEGEEFVLIPHGRLQVDFFGFWRGDDPSPRLPETTFVVRRVRAELNGTILRRVDFQIAGDFTTGGQFANNQGVTDAWIAIELLPSLRLQLGQHDAPFTLENRTSDKYFDFMERSVTVRAFGVPTNKEAGAWFWGLLPRQVAYYSVGVFNGIGQNFRNQDGRLDFMGRAWIAPFQIGRYAPLGEATFGGSFWYGSRGNTSVELAPMTTQGGYPFFRTTYALADTAATEVRLLPRRNQVKWALEADVPVKNKWGFRFELVHNDLGLDEVTGPANAFQRRGQLQGTSFYVQTWYYLLGDDNVIPRPGLQVPHRVRPYEPVLAPRHALQVLARYERLRMRYDNDASLSAAMDPAVGEFALDSLELGINYWATKHLRFTFNYVFTHFGGDAGMISGAAGRPVGGSDYLHEFLARVAIAL